MGLLQWLKAWFVPRPVVRNVAGMSSDAVGADAGTRQEIIDTSGEPLKAGHRRRALREGRLLPKPKATGWLGRRKKAKVMPREEADRLFSDTLRTSDRQVRDLLADVDQLRRYGLPLWTN